MFDFLSPILSLKGGDFVRLVISLGEIMSWGDFAQGDHVPGGFCPTS